MILDTMQFRSNKRGQLTLKPFIEIVVAITIFFIFYYSGVEFGTGEIFEKIQVTRDAALTLDAFNALPGNAYLEFPLNTSDFYIDIKEDKIKIYSYAADPNFGSYLFVKRQGQTLDKEFARPSSIYFQKSGDELKVSKELEPEQIKKQECPERSSRIGNIIITPVSGLSDALAAFIDAEVKEDIPEDTGLLIQLEKEQAEGIRLELNILPNTNSRRLACLIQDQLIEEKISIHTSVSKKYPLSEAKAGISIKIGEQLSKSKIINAVSKAVKEI
ncbi:hypothetical protein GF336_07020 [Candidatus Woesearchaeota archaeon]|nr:hypothetical protein [Candidatus Woesearchaeota archaeon]